MGANPNKSPLKIVEKKGRGRTQRLPNFLGTPIISGTGKATNFCSNIHRVDRNKSPCKMLQIVAMGVVRESQKFSGHPSIRTLRGHLCDSTAFFCFAVLHLQTQYVHLLLNNLNWYLTIVSMT